jgi:hypothetical protein
MKEYENTSKSYEANSLPDNMITLETLMPYREYMSLCQLERYGDYILNLKPDKPFIWAEIDQPQAIRNTQKEKFKRD